MGSQASTNELIPHSMDGAEMYRAGWISLQFLAEFQDVIVDGPGRRIILVAPNLVQQFIAADDPLGVLHQKLKRLEFHLLEISSDVIKTDNLSFGHTGRVPQGGANPRE